MVVVVVVVVVEFMIDVLIAHGGATGSESERVREGIPCSLLYALVRVTPLAMGMKSPPRAIPNPPVGDSTALLVVVLVLLLLLLA